MMWEFINISDLDNIYEIQIGNTKNTVTKKNHNSESLLDIYEEYVTANQSNIIQYYCDNLTELQNSIILLNDGMYVTRWLPPSNCCIYFRCD